MTSPDTSVALEQLAEQVQACTRCDLYRNATHGVPGEGPAHSDIMLVGEGPGRNEDRQGRPFVGAAGQFLEELLGIAALTREDVYITNVVKHWPNRDNGRFLENRPPEPDEILACSVYLDQQIMLIQPRLVVTLGRYSLGAFFPGEMISKVHGQVRERDGRFYFHMYHPAAALHQQALRETLLADMKKLAAFLKGPFQKRADVDPAQANSSQDVDDGGDAEQLSLF